MIWVFVGFEFLHAVGVYDTSNSVGYDFKGVDVPSFNFFYYWVVFILFYYSINGLVDVLVICVCEINNL